MNRKSPIDAMSFLFAFVFTLVGIFAIFLGTNNVIHDQRLLNEGIPINAVITDISSHTYEDSDGDIRTKYDVFVSYSVNGESYQKKLSEYNSTMHNGDPLTLYYFPGNTPESADYVSISWDFIFIFLFGGIFSAVGIGFAISLVKRLLSKRLLSTGIPIMADVKYCGYGNVRINGRRTYSVQCEWTDENGIYHAYKSATLMYDPTDALNDNQVEVFVNPNNYNKYCVNL